MSETYSTTKHINELANDILKAMQLPKTQTCVFCKEPLSKSDIEIRNSKSCWSCSLENNHEDGFYLEQAEIDYEEYLDE